MYMYIYIYVCVFMCIFTYIYTRTYIHTYRYTYINTYLQGFAPRCRPLLLGISFDPLPRSKGGLALFQAPGHLRSPIEQVLSFN